MTIKVRLVLDGREHEVELVQEDGGWIADVDGERFPVRSDRSGHGALVTAGSSAHHVTLSGPSQARIDGREHPFRLLGLSGVAGAEEDAAGGHGAIRPPMTGRLEAVLVQTGQAVERGDVLFVLEAMKMRNEVKAPAAGVISAVHATPGTTVDPGTTILELSPPA